MNGHFSETHPPKSEHCSDLENGTEKWTLPKINSEIFVCSYLNNLMVCYKVMATHPAVI